MARPAAGLVLVTVLAAAGLVIARSTGNCVGECQRLDGNGNCRTVYNCQSGGGGGEDTALGSIFGPTPCRQHCYAYVRGRCRLKFSCLLG